MANRRSRVSSRTSLTIGLSLTAALTACATPQPAPISTLEPPLDMRYLALESTQKKTICITVDAAASGGPERAKVFRAPIVDQFTAYGYSVVEDCRRAYVKLTYELPPKFIAHVTSAGQPAFSDGSTTTAGMAFSQAGSILSEGYSGGFALASLAAAFGVLQKDAMENRRLEPFYIVVGNLNVQLGDNSSRFAQVRAIVPDKTLVNRKDSHELTVLVTRENATVIGRAFSR